jgi:hypothetical protein
MEDKRQITLVVSSIVDGFPLPLHIIFTSTTNKTLPLNNGSKTMCINNG